MVMTATKTWRDYLGESDQLFKQVKELLHNAEATQEEQNKLQPMLEDARALKAKALALKEIETAAAEIETEVKAHEEKTGEDAGASGALKWDDFLYEVWRAGHPNIKAAPDKRLRFFKDEQPAGHERKDMVEGTGASGGFLVPGEYRAELQSAMGEAGIVRSRATVIPMRRRQIDLPVLNQTGTTAGIPHWFGGMRFYWEEEAAEKTETDPTFKKVSLVAHKLIGYTRASDELLDDSAISLSAFLSGPLGFAGGATWMEDYAFLRGTGAGQPLGILNAGATIVEGRAVAGAIGIDDITDMLQDFMPTSRGVWIITQSAMSALMQLNGPAANPSYWWMPNGRDGAPGVLAGFPVIWSEKLPLLGTQGDILLADMSYYLIGDRQAVTVESTKFDRWAYDETSWRMVLRVDGQPWLSAPLTLQDGTTQISPFVILGDAVGS